MFNGFGIGSPPSFMEVNASGCVTSKLYAIAGIASFPVCQFVCMAVSVIYDVHIVIIAFFVICVCVRIGASPAHFVVPLE